MAAVTLNSCKPNGFVEDKKLDGSHELLGQLLAKRLLLGAGILILSQQLTFTGTAGLQLQSIQIWTAMQRHLAQEPRGRSHLDDMPRPRPP